MTKLSSPGYRTEPAVQRLEKREPHRSSLCLGCRVMQQAHPTCAKRSAALEPDRMVRLLATDDYHVHRLIYEAFARDGVRDFLFAPFPVSGELHGVLVRFRDVKTHFFEGQGFQMILRAFPTVKVAGKRRSIGAARAKDSLRLRWIHARTRANGFDLVADPAMHVERIRLEDAKTPFGINTCIYRAPVRVTEPGRFTRAYTQGVGQGRAWGCGMLILRDTASGRP